MEKKAVSGIMLTLFLISMLTLAFNIQPVKAEPTTIVVPDDYPTIQEAIDNANEGDTVRVRAGTYSEQITINKDRLKILGESWETTVVDLLSIGRVDVFRIVANDIRLSGFTIQNGNDAVIIDDSSNINITNIMIANNSGGIFVDNSTEIILEENIITSNSLTGVQVTNSYRFILRNNEITWHTKGLRLSYVQNSILYNNSILNNGGGIRLYKVNNTRISNNEILAPGKGVDSDNSSNNTIVENTFSNSYRAIQLAYHSDNNMIYHNNFQDNANDVYLSGSYYNSWDNGYPSGGNYWSDYAGVDLYGGPDQNLTEGIGSDGIGDTPYVIDSNNLDYYPLTIPWTSETLLHPLEGQYANYTIRVTNPSDGTILDETRWNLTYHKYVSPFLIYVMSWIDHPYSEWDWTALNITNRYAYHFNWPITGRIGDTWFSGWIETNITTGSTIKLLDGTATMVSDKIMKINSRSIDCWELLHIEESTIEHTFWYDKTTGLLIGQEAIADSVKVNTTLVDTNIIQLIPPSPTERTEELLETIDTWDLPKGTENSLTSKLEGAIHLLDIGNEKGAIHKLMGFINQLEALRGKKLTTKQANQLISEAQRIIDLIKE